MSAPSWGRLMARHRRVVIGVWIVLLLAAGASYPWLQNRLGAPNYGVTGSQSAHADALMARYFAGQGSEQDVIVFDAASGKITSPRARAVIGKIISGVDRMDEVAGVIGPFDPRARGLVSRDGRAALAQVGLTGATEADRADNARTVQKQVRSAVRANGSTVVRAWLAGYSPTSNDLTDVENADAERSEMIGIPVALIVLLLALGAVVAAVIPLLLALAGLLLTFGVIALLSLGFTFDAFLVVIVTMIGIGVGIDYSLFVVSRFREELARRGVRRRGDLDEAGRAEAVAGAAGVAVTTSGRTVIMSGVLVAISMCSMFVVDSPVFHEISIGVVAVVACTLAAALTLLPAVLAALGPRVNGGSLPERWRPAEMRVNPAAGGGWARWAHAVMRRPVALGLAAAALLVVLALPLGGLRYGIDLGTTSLGDKPAAQAQRVLDRSFGPGVVSPVQIIVTGPDERPLDPAGREVAAQLVGALRAQHEVANADTTSAHGRVMITAVPSVPIDSHAATDLVEHIRSDLVPAMGHGVEVSVGGATAQFVDLGDETTRKVPWILTIVLGLSFCFLLVTFRSLILPLKAVAMNLLSTAAAVGLTIAAFQWGWGEGLLGFHSVGFLQVYLPITVFVLLFGLSMDYEVFLVRRMRETWLAARDNAAAVANGIEHTARPISAAAAIMVAVFGSFMAADVLELKEFGLALAAAIALDATLVRLVLVPAFMKLLGRWNWWLPARVGAMLPGGSSGTVKSSAPEPSTGVSAPV